MIIRRALDHDFMSAQVKNVQYDGSKDDQDWRIDVKYFDFFYSKKY